MYSDSGLLHPRQKIIWRATHESFAFLSLVFCWMKLKVRAGHKYLSCVNKCSKAYSKKNRAMLGHTSVSTGWWVIFENILYRAAKQDLDHSGHETGIIKKTKWNETCQFWIFQSNCTKLIFLKFFWIHLAELFLIHFGDLSTALDMLWELKIELKYLICHKQGPSSENMYTSLLSAHCTTSSCQF